MPRALGRLTHSSARSIETRLAGVGGDLSAAKKHPDAIEVLELNARLFPSSAAAHAALAEAHAAAGNVGLAKQHYEKALTIDPKNEAARKALAKLAATTSP